MLASASSGSHLPGRTMGLLFDRTNEGRVIKCLTIVDDATNETVAIDQTP